MTMNTNSSKRRSHQVVRRALVLAAGTTGMLLAVSPVSAKEQSGQAKITLSPKFQPAYIALAKQIEADKTRPDLAPAQAKAKAATDNASRNAAAAELGGMLSAEKAQLAAAAALAATADDRFMVGQLELQLGTVAVDNSLQRQGLLDMLASGKSNPADVGKFQFYIGNFAYSAGDYPGAITAFQASTATGYHDNDVEVLLADSYLKNHQIDKGLPALQSVIDRTKAAGQPVPVGWYRIGVVAAYNAKLVGPALSFGKGLILEEPGKKNWGLLLEVVRSVAHYPAQDELDLMRLMGRTNSYAEKQDFLEYIQSADARRLPGEVLDVIAAGTSSGMLSGGDPTISEAKSIANARVTADRASLPSLERDARAPGANAATASAAGDALLSYGKSADAIAMYQIALGKPGVDTPRVLTRLGIAQTDSGDFAGAQATFAKITGPREPLGQLWSIYAAEKAAGK
jgi:tetratricopeptide (TPR) repeat protein